MRRVKKYMSSYILQYSTIERTMERRTHTETTLGHARSTEQQTTNVSVSLLEGSIVASPLTRRFRERIRNPDKHKELHPLKTLFMHFVHAPRGGGPRPEPPPPTPPTPHLARRWEPHS